MEFFVFEDAEHIQRERRKAQELRKSSWWKQQIGRGVCYYCEGRFAKENLTMDHVVPVARGGKSTKKNCVVCCKECNNRKGHLMTVEMTLATLASGNSSPVELSDEPPDEHPKESPNEMNGSEQEREDLP